ncbi:MAG: methyltransferase family protein [Candidatus Dormibacteria bacterium]
MIFALFLVLQAGGAWGSLSGFLRQPGAHLALDFLNRLLGAAFMGLLVGLYVTRPRPVRSTHTARAGLTAFTGSFILLLVPFLSALRGGGLRLVAADALQAAGIAVSVGALLWLRRNFSILPEARRLVTGGPYRLVRHPVYLGELVAAAGLLLPRLDLTSAAIGLVFLSAQLGRMRLEEAVLGAAFPEYAGYAARTRRLVPFLWVG